MNKNIALSLSVAFLLTSGLAFGQGQSEHDPMKLVTSRKKKQVPKKLTPAAKPNPTAKLKESFEALQDLIGDNAEVTFDEHSGMKVVNMVIVKKIDKTSLSLTSTVSVTDGNLRSEEIIEPDIHWSNLKSVLLINDLLRSKPGVALVVKVPLEIESKRTSKGSLSSGRQVDQARSSSGKQDIFLVVFDKRSDARKAREYIMAIISELGLPLPKTEDEAKDKG